VTAETTTCPECGTALELSFSPRLERRAARVVAFAFSLTSFFVVFPDGAFFIRHMLSVKDHPKTNIMIMVVLYAAALLFSITIPLFLIGLLLLRPRMRDWEWRVISYGAIATGVAVFCSCGVSRWLTLF
jgi:hypothetical protein